MSNSNLPVNPWLGERIMECRERHPEQDLRSEYRAYCALEEPTGVMVHSWGDFLAAKALIEALEQDSFLLTLRMEMGLPDATKEALYRCHVDMVADLLQISEEEMLSYAEKRGFDIVPIKKYLAKQGKQLFRCSRPTVKYQAVSFINGYIDSDWKKWTVDLSGDSHPFDINRPTLLPPWFDHYYARYEKYEDEDRFYDDFKDLRLDSNEDGSMHYSYDGYFVAHRDFWKNYKQVCNKTGIPKRVPTPKLPKDITDLEGFSSDKLVTLKEKACRAMISVFELNCPLKHHTVGQYLAMNDTGRLDAIEMEEENPDLQAMLLSLVEIKIDLENLVYEFKEVLAKRKRHDLIPRPGPVDPEMVRRILKYREAYTDDTLRERYLSWLEDNPEGSWPDFICKAAQEDL